MVEVMQVNVKQMQLLVHCSKQATVHQFTVLQTSVTYSADTAAKSTCCNEEASDNKRDRQSTTSSSIAITVESSTNMQASADDESLFACRILSSALCS